MRKIQLFFAAAVIATVGFMIYSYFYVDGTEFKEVFQISDTSEVVIKKYKLGESGVHDEQKITLKSAQNEMLESLFRESKFKRVLSSVVYYDDNDFYDITINDNEQKVYLNLSMIGGEYISGANKFDGKHLKILNPQWKSKLDEIIAFSQ